MCKYIDGIYPPKWIGRDGPVTWSPHLPDLNPLDPFLWEHKRPLFYETPVKAIEEIIVKIVTDAVEIKKAPANRVCTEVNRSSFNVFCVIMSPGLHFEQFLQKLSLFWETPILYLFLCNKKFSIIFLEKLFLVSICTFEDGFLRFSSIKRQLRLHV